jgi:hypothetical protein
VGEKGGAGRRAGRGQDSAAGKCFKRFEFHGFNSQFSHTFGGGAG